MVHRASVASRSRRGTAINTWRRIETVTRQLELCALASGEQVVVIATAATDPALVELLTIGVHRHGATMTGVVVDLHLADPTDDPLGVGPAAAAIGAADLALDLTGRAAAAVPASDHLRLLTVAVRCVADLDRIVAHPGLPRRVERAVDVLTSTGTLLWSSSAGTLLDIGLTDSQVVSDAGVAPAPGDRARWPGGIVSAAPRPDIVNGSVVLMPGDLLVDVAHTVRSPVRLEIAGGRVTEIHGDTADADVVRHTLETLDPDNAARVRSVSIGLACTMARGIPQQSAAETLHTGGRCGLVLEAGSEGSDASISMCLATVSVTADQVELVMAGDLVGVVEPDVYELAACG